MSLTYKGGLVNAVQRYCTASVLPYLLTPILVLINPLNFPAFLTAQVIFWLVVYFPVRKMSHRLFTTTDEERGKVKRETLISDLTLKEFVTAMLAYSILYHIVCIPLSRYIGCLPRASASAPYLEDFPPEYASLPPGTPININRMNTSLVA